MIFKKTYPPKIQKRLGHASLKITMDTYAHFFDKHDKKVVDTQGHKRGTFFSGAEINYDKHEKGDKRLSLVLLGL